MLIFLVVIFVVVTIASGVIIEMGSIAQGLIAEDKDEPWADG